ncbi:MAG: DUF4249 domain-containing protein [Bacteroidota bacterium]|nr:DUF4249 domain-containing protein [Bacteroidota bacterium]
MKHQLIFKFILLTFVCVSCEKEINVTLPPYDTKLVVNGELNNESEISLQVSKSISILTNSDSTGYLLNNAIVNIYENNTLLGTGTYFSGKYEFNFKPQVGRIYEIRASHPNYTAVNAVVTMPKSLSFNSTFIDSIGLDNVGLKVGQLTLNINDDGNETNYYQLLIKYYNPGFLEWFPFDFVSNDEEFINNTKLNDGSYLFSDTRFNGRTKTFRFEVPFGLATGTPKFEVSIKSIGADFYEYINQTNEYNQTGTGFIPNPIILKSNVTNGLGMIGGVINQRDTIK